MRISKKMERRMAAYQQDLMEKHCEEVENMYRQTRGWRHDYRNHIQTMKAYLSMGQYEELSRYLDQLDEDLSQVDTVIKTGNVMMDAVLNSKISVARAKQITVEAKASVPQRLSIAEVDLCVILGNLLDNAVKYTPEGGSVHIRVRPWQFYTRVDITDTGIGIPEEHCNDVFKRFYRAQSSAASEGVGLGLYLARGIITRQRGYITLKSEVGKGSSFSVFLLR